MVRPGTSVVVVVVAGAVIVPVASSLAMLRHPNYVAVGIELARVAEPYHHRLAGGVDRVLNEREAHLRGRLSIRNDVGVDVRRAW